MLCYVIGAQLYRPSVRYRTLFCLCIEVVLQGRSRSEAVDKKSIGEKTIRIKPELHLLEYSTGMEMSGGKSGKPQINQTS